MPAAERADYSEVWLSQLLRDALAWLNPALPAEALYDAFRKLTRTEDADLIQRNRMRERVFKDKPGGLVVDYQGLAHELKAALAIYTESGGTGCPAFDKDKAVAVMLEKYEVCCGLFHGFDRS